jgi:DNA-binding FadR family transcriptional regulator
MDADYEFHSGVARASGNTFLEGVMEAMRTPIEFTIDLARSLAMRHPMDHLLTVQAEHVRRHVREHVVGRREAMLERAAERRREELAGRHRSQALG